MNDILDHIEATERIAEMGRLLDGASAEKREEVLRVFMVRVRDAVEELISSLQPITKQ